MRRKLTPQSTLEGLKKEAKRWLKALRANIQEARARLELAFPNAPTLPTLRDVQHARALEHGLPGWSALKDSLTDRTPVSAGHAERVAWFLENACPDHHIRGGPAHVQAYHTAMRLLTRYPEIAHESFTTAIVCGNLAEVDRVLAEGPDAASQKPSVPGPDRARPRPFTDPVRDLGPKRWEPLLYLCFTRLPLAEANDNAVAIARTLLDHGADPNVYFMAGDSRYTPLVGAIGEGEENRPPHPQRDALVRLLLERGAEPYDIQVVYNIGFHGHVLWFLQAIHAQAVKLGRQADWDDPAWNMLDMGGYGSGARWHLGIAVRDNDLELAEWALTHGANPDAAPPRDKRMSKVSLYEEALRGGLTEMAELFVRHGAEPGKIVLTGEEAFAAAALRLDRAAVQGMVAEHPEYLRSTQAIFTAAKHDRADVLTLLLDLGMSPDVEDVQKQRPLHIAAYAGSLRVAELLIERGAVIDPVESKWSNTPLGAAQYAQHRPMIDLFARYSRDVFELTYAGKVERLRELLEEEPKLAKSVDTAGYSLLWWLPPGDEARAMEIARLLLAQGVDPAIRNKEGRSPANYVRKLGLDDVADLLEAAAPDSTTPLPPPVVPHLEQFQSLAADLVAGYGSGDAVALSRLSDHFGQALTRDGLRARLQERLAALKGTEPPTGAIGLDDGQLLVARFYGFESWVKLVESVAQPPSEPRLAPSGLSSTPPFYRIDHKRNIIELRSPLSDGDWDTVFGVMKDLGITGLNPGGQMTDAVLARVARLDAVTKLQLEGSRRLTDDGLLHISRMPQLQELELGGAITDRGLEVLRQLPELRHFQMTWARRISDAGVGHLTFCDQIENVNLLGSTTGDGAINALRGKPHLRHFRTGRLVTDAGLPLLHDFPVFKTWQGGEQRYDLMSFGDVEPNFLMLDGPFSDRGVAALTGLDGIFGLGFFRHVSGLTASGLSSLHELHNLGALGCEGTICDDTAMRHIVSIPRLRMLMAQGIVASDDGFTALSKSQTIEYIWGRECPNLQGRGFAALAAMPALKGLGVSCKNVDDAALSALPRFPALRGLMPMDVSDDGFRHVGRCDQLENLWCMYCRDTGDAATEHIGGLPGLKFYYAGKTRITDRSLKILARMSSLEVLEFWEIAGITSAGVALLAGLPKLREISVAAPKVTREAMAVFPASVRVDYW